jgi:GNAT superfamily N-acetyltransferase
MAGEGVLLVEPDHRGQGHGRRTLVVFPNGYVQEFLTIADAARHEGVARETTSRRVRNGTPHTDGRRVV